MCPRSTPRISEPSVSSWRMAVSANEEVEQTAANANSCRKSRAVNLDRNMIFTFTVEVNPWKNLLEAI